MNIVFLSADDGNDTMVAQEFIEKKLKELRRRGHCITGAQVNFGEVSDVAGAGKVCKIDLTHYGEPISLRKSAVSYEQAAQEAVSELTALLEKAVKSIPF